MSDFAGKVALVTGAGNGIGRATALAFARRGAKIVATDLEQDALDTLSAAVKEMGGEILALVCDGSSADDCDRMMAETRKRFGRLDAALNNVGVGDFDPDRKLAEKPLSVWQRTMEVTLFSAFYALRAEIPLMLEHGGGAIVNTASIAGMIAFPNTAAYITAKHGIIGLTKAACVEYAAQGIRCNAVAPGNTRTRLLQAALDASPDTAATMTARVPAGRLGEAEEIAEAVVWLCSPAASYVNGVCLPVDGGFVAG